jgi:hypothetical protein
VNHLLMTKLELYEKLEDYYNNSGLYDDMFEEIKSTTIRYNIRNVGRSLFRHRIDGQRNPVHRTIEFYTSKIIPGDISNIKISTDKQTVLDAIYQIITWSNFATNKQRDVRHLSLHGNLFYKANSDGKKVWFDIIDSKYVTSFREDNRGYLLEIRIDTPKIDNVGQIVWRTEYWNKEESYYAIWETYTSPQTLLENLGTPIETGFIEELGLGNMIPIVHMKFIDAGYPEGMGAVQHVLSKIEESNRQVKRLHEILFRFGKPVIAISSNAEGKDGSPIAPPLLEEGESISNDNDILYLPGKATATPLIPSIDYASALNILNAQLDEIEQDLPECKYYKLSENHVSGKAIKLTMGAAVSKAEECRGNFVTGLTRIIQICLTLGDFWNIFSNIGTYENGDFDFTVNLSEMFPMDDNEKAVLLKDLTTANMPLASALKIVGYDDSFIEEVLANKTLEDTQKATQNLNAFNAL